MSETLPQYPASDLDDPNALLNELGPWASTYLGVDQVAAICQSQQTAQQQAWSDFRELVACISRHSLPILHTENWYPLTLSAMDMNASEQNIARWGDAGLVFAPGSLHYGQPNRPLYAWTLPAGLVRLPMLFNRITQPSRSLVLGIDYQVYNGSIYFRDNPFVDPLIPVTDDLSEDSPVFQTVTLWVCRAGFDRRYLQEQFAYVLGLDMPSTVQAKQLVNAIFDSMRSGTTQQQLMLAFSAITDVPLAIAGETVQQLNSTSASLQVITDKNVYNFSTLAVPLVAVGQTLAAGQAMTDAMIPYEFNRGQVPDVRDVSSLTLSTDLMIPGFTGGITFPNLDVPVVVSTDGDGFTRLDWHLGGAAGDVQWFFDAMHARGLAAGKTIAHLLDTRPPGTPGEPSSGDLPSIINPLGFLAANVLRNGGLLVKIRASALGPNAIGLDFLPVIRKVMLPQALLLVQIELAGTVTTVTLDDLPG